MGSPGAGIVEALASPALDAAVFGDTGGRWGGGGRDARGGQGARGEGVAGRGGDPTAGKGAGPGASVVAADAWPSPFLAFAVAVHRTAANLERASYVEERLAPRVRVPVFDAGVLRAVLGDPLRRYFFVELLASYTRVSSGVTWTRTPRGWRRRRFSELDPARLAALLDQVDERERPGVYRRLGDLSLFLLGVFPDHPPMGGAGAGADRLLRSSGISGISGIGREAADLDPQVLFERLGAAWYRAAGRVTTALGQPLTGTLAVAGYMADHFGSARRVLNAVTDRYLFPNRSRWFAA